jgi:hypothetical protein
MIDLSSSIHRVIVIRAFDLSDVLLLGLLVRKKT